MLAINEVTNAAAIINFC